MLDKVQYNKAIERYEKALKSARSTNGFENGDKVEVSKNKSVLYSGDKMDAVEMRAVEEGSMTFPDFVKSEVLKKSSSLRSAEKVILDGVTDDASSIEVAQAVTEFEMAVTQITQVRNKVVSSLSAIFSTPL